MRSLHARSLSLAHAANALTQPPNNAATFVGTDATTSGNWKGVYGSDGYNVINDAASYPAYAQVSASGQTPYTWAASTSDQRALLKAASSTDRIAACWYSVTNFTIDVNLTDGNNHRVSIYSLDWDGNNARSERIEILDAGTDGVLDSRDVTSYSGGKYSTWNLQGHVKIRVTNLYVGGSNAVISGLFFDPVQDAGALALARLDPFNQPGNQLLARDCEWSLPLVSLPGRAGLDLGLSLSYSSQVWTRAGSYLYFDEDDGSPSPGFRLGFPTIQNPFFDNQAGVNARLLITSSGRKVELRQVGSSNLYEAGDSSYLQLFDYGSSLWMRTTDGTQMAFAAAGDQWVCWLIKDRNGNQITANYNAQGDLSSVIDTLGRVINFNYDGNANLSSITQNGRSEPWATFGWSTLTLQPGFGLPTVAPSEGIPVLTQVGLDDESRYNFEYTAQGQVKMIRRYTFDNSQYVERSYTAYDYENPTGDCPRISAARVWAENWSDLYGVPHEVPTYFHDNGDGSHQMTSPDGTIYKESYGTSGWQRGLSLVSEVRSGGVRQKWSTLGWIQDNPAANYQTNPRVIQTTIDDSSGNHRRTTINYDHLNYAQYGLPFQVTEYGGTNGETELRRTYTDYNLTQPYLAWHIIGLVSSVYFYDPATAQMSAKTTYGYDAPALIDPQATTATQHDQSFSASFTIRGNLTSVSRWDANDIENGSKALTTQMAYDAAGSVIYTRDPLNHVASFHFGDSFSDGVDHNTFAYAATVTDADGNNSSTQFNYLFGAATRVQGPPASNQTNGTGAVQTFAYDTARRLEQVTTLNNGAYVRYIYQGNAVHQYSTVNNVADEAYAAKFFDGAGHLIFDEGNHPASGGLYRAVYIIYDAMGRAVKQSNPTEIGPNAVPTGDDWAGWIYTQQTYDWKGRPLITTNTDGRQKSASYTACGCAGSEATTVMDEAGRQTRTTNDALGRLAKVEELNWDATVYSTANYSYNALDQLTSINHEGQVRSFAYDGYGRVQTRTTPEQGATTYAYYPDDTTQSVTDARGAVASYGYNNRHLVTSINYTVPGGVAATPDVSVAYDAAGNRMAIYDGLGSTHYGYDQLSRMTAETRHFNDLPNNYDLTYGYNLAGELTGITNSWGAQVGYGYDQTGRLTNVSGANYAGVSSYASGINYRAFGAVKGMSYGDGHSLSTGYDNRLRPTTWNVSGVLGYNYAYDYYSEHTGRVTYAQNIANGSPPTNGAPDPTLDRSYQYDQVGALVIAHSGAEARASAYSGQWGTMDGPYSLGFDYDQYGNMTHRYGWGGEVQGDNPTHNPPELWYGYTGNRRNDFGYDAAGNVINDGTQSFLYDATGQQATATASNYFLQQGYDGDGLRAQKTENGAATYYLRSSVLGGKVVAEIDGSGNWSRGYVYAGSDLLAVQQQSAVNWVHEDSVTKSQRVTDANGNLVNSGTVELDPWGANTNRSSNSAFQPQQFTTYIRDANGGQDAMARRYATSSARFSQPDPYGGSYDFSDPQSLNRYAYAGNDPVNHRDPSGLMPNDCVDAEGNPVKCEWIVTVHVSWADRIIDGYGADQGLDYGLLGGGIRLHPLREPQNSHEAGHSEAPNPNCLRYAVRGSPGVGDPFRVNVTDPSFSGHIGAHALSPLGHSAEAVTLPPLAGKIIKTNAQDSQLFYLDVRLTNGNVAVYFDLQTVQRKSGYLRAGDVFGTVRPGDPRNDVGLHVTIVRGQYYNDFNLHRAQYTVRGPTKYFIDPLGPESPIRCPGETVKP